MARKSSVKLLPPDIKALADRLIGEDRTTQLEILALVNAELERRGGAPVSRSAFNRYALTMAKAGERVRQTREIAAVWTRELGAMPEGDVGKLLTEVVRTLAFDTASRLSEEDVPAPPMALMALARAVHDLQKAASMSADTEIKIRERVAREAAGAAKKAAVGAGLTAETAQLIYDRVLGVRKAA